LNKLSFSYFPGCSQESSAREYGLSTEAVAKALCIELKELPDWNCCGASSAHMTNDLLSILLPARNLAIASRIGKDLLVPCAACYSRLRSAQMRLAEDEELSKKVAQIIGESPIFSGQIRNLLEVIMKDVDLSSIKRWKRNDLSGLKAVPYYGCLLVRPRELCSMDSVENPTLLDKLLETLGVEVMKWSYKTDCCGGSLSLSRPDLVERLVTVLFKRAKEAGANCIVTVCSMCAANLEMRQVPGKLSFCIHYNIPVFYFTELLGIYLGIGGSRRWLESHIIDPIPLVENAGISLL